MNKWTLFSDSQQIILLFYLYTEIEYYQIYAQTADYSSQMSMLELPSNISPQSYFSFTL